MTDYKVAIDIGGTDIKAAVLDNGLNFVDYQKIPTPNNTNEYIVDKVYDIVKHFQMTYKLSPLHVGISSAGVIDETNAWLIILALPFLILGAQISPNC